MKDRVLFIAGSTGAVGRALVSIADARGLSIVPHVRPKRAAAGPVDPRAAVLDLSDTKALAGVLERCTTVIQLIGTMRKRFSSGDTYETSDIGTTAQLVGAARTAGIDHLVLLSSLGAGHPRGAYLKAKASAEALVRESGIAFTIFRPSMFLGGGHPMFPGAMALSRALRPRAMAPIPVEELASAILHVATTRDPVGGVLEGPSLWKAVEAAKADKPAASR